MTTTLRVQVWVEVGGGVDVVVCYEVTCRLIRMLLPKQLRTFPQSMQQPGQWAAHLIRGVDIPVACYTCTETLAQIYQRKKVLEEKTNRKRKKINFQNAARAMRFTSDSGKYCKDMQRLCDAWKMHEYVAHTVQVSENCEHSTVYSLFSSERHEHHSTVCRYDPISCNYHALPMLALHCTAANITRWQSLVQWTDVASCQC